MASLPLTLLEKSRTTAEAAVTLSPCVVLELSEDFVSKYGNFSADSDLMSRSCELCLEK